MYPHLVDPFVALAAAATATSRLVVGTGVCMVLEHDVLQLANQAASLDVLSNGRFHLGVGVGWLPEELANHRPDVSWSQRYIAAAERVEALRTCWTQDEASFEGHWDRFTSSWINPKPIQNPLPVGFGCSGPRGMNLAAHSADEWFPIDGVLANQGGISEALKRFAEMVATAGRSIVPVTIFVWGWAPGEPSISQLEAYCELDIHRLVLAPPTMGRHDEATTLGRLDEFQDFVDRHRHSR